MPDDNLPKKRSAVESSVAKYLRDFERQQRLMAESPILKFAREAAEQQQIVGRSISKVAQDFERQQRLTAESPVLKFAREAEEQQQIAGRSISKIVQDFERQKRLMAESPVLRFAQEAAEQQQIAGRSISKIVQDFERQQRLMAESPIYKIAGDFQQMLTAVGDLRSSLGAIAAARDIASLAAISIAGVQPTNMTALNAELIALHECLSSDVSGTAHQSVRSHLTSVCDHLIDLLENARSEIEKRALWKVVIWLLPLIFAWYLSATGGQAVVQQGDETRELIQRQAQIDRDERNRRAEEQEQRDQEIGEKIDALSRLIQQQMTASKGQFYVVERAVPLCETKRFCKQHLTTLLPGSEVELIARDGKWIRVRVLLESTEVEGWVLKKYLLRLR
jgi:hypothetical protein